MNCQKRLIQELRCMVDASPVDVFASPIDDLNLLKWTGILIGPENTPYSGGKFRLILNFTTNYPNTPPTVNFETRIYHCNVNSHGRICLNILDEDWDPRVSITQVLIAVRELLVHPNPSDPLVGSIATELISAPHSHDKTARRWAQLYADAPIIQTNELQ